MLSRSVMPDSATPWAVACQALLSMGTVLASQQFQEDFVIPTFQGKKIEVSEPEELGPADPGGK